KYAMKEFIDFINNVGAIRESPLQTQSSSQTQNDYPGLLDPEITILDHYLDMVEEFYRLADERSIHFADNLLEKMEREEENLAVMINGGFHADKVLAELQRRNVTYVSIKPRVIRHDVVNPYFDLLRNRQNPLEELLAKNQTIMAIWTALDNKQFLANLELIFKPWAKALTLNVNERERLKMYLAENDLIEVAMISESQALEAGLKNMDGVKVFSTTLISAAGEPIVVLLAPEGEISKRLEQKPLDSKTIGNMRIDVYSSLQDAAKVTQAIQKSRTWISTAVAGIMEWAKDIPEKILTISNKKRAGVKATLTLPVLYKIFSFLPKRTVGIFIAPLAELRYTARISVAALLGMKIPKYGEISKALMWQFLEMHKDKEKIKHKYNKGFRNVANKKIEKDTIEKTIVVLRLIGIQWIIRGAKYGMIAGVFAGISSVIAAMLFGGMLPLLGPMNIFTAMIIIIAMPVTGFLMGNILPHALYNSIYTGASLSLEQDKPRTPLSALALTIAGEVPLADVVHEPEYNVPLDKRNRLLDHVRLTGFRRGALLIMGAFFLMAAPVFAFTQPLNTLSAGETDQHGQMIGFKRSH
ncbi:hypothetical protein KAR10_01645, partial [bacterium]|nr:hypothetical protein [bacterium]